MITWKIEKRKLKDLNGYDKNPRKFTEKGLKDLKASLERLGDANIITINADNTILGGHARATVMNQLGYNEVDVKVPSDLLSEEQVKEIVVRLNANTAGDWDLDMLESEFDLDELHEWGLDVEFNTDFDLDDVPAADENNDEEFMTKRITISYTEDKEWVVKQLLKLDEITKYVYDIEELI